MPEETKSHPGAKTRDGEQVAKSQPTAPEKPAPGPEQAPLGLAAANPDALPSGVDPRLDNRTGDQRPDLESYPAKPQQIDGPEVGRQAEHAEAVKDRNVAEEVAAGLQRNAKGMFSPGPHGVDVEDTREQSGTFGTEGIKV